MDPIDIRLINARKANTVTPNGYEVKSYYLKEANEMARDASGWKDKKGKLPVGRGSGLAMAALLPAQVIACPDRPAALGCHDQNIR